MSVTANVTGTQITAVVQASSALASVASSGVTASPSGDQVSAAVQSVPTAASVTGGTMAALVTSSPVSASASGGVGPQGPAGAAGDVTVPAGLSNLSDVSLAGLADGDLLRYSASRWRNFREDILVDGGNFVVLLAILSIR